MNTVENIKSVWEEWEIIELLGEGSYGKVYKAVKRDHTAEMFSAIKIITIPKAQSELKSLRSEGMTIDESKTYLEGIVNGFVNEIKMMINLSSVPNIVNVYDYKVIEKKEEIGWEIHIRMELLTSFEDFITDKILTEAEIIKVGKDICSALEVCANQTPPIIHRDIKPDNIFVTKTGDFKLGDFGVAREIEKTKGSYSEAGTPIYMAPEVKNRNSYGATADICSLGLVLYRLTNNNRLPFCDPNKQMLNHDERLSALNRRFNGEPIPAPVNATEQVAQVILRACEFVPEDRFQSASAFKAALEVAGKGEYVPDDLDKTTEKRKPPTSDTSVINPHDKPDIFGKKKSKIKMILIAIIAIICVAGITTGVIFIKIMNDPAAKAVNALVSGDYSDALTYADKADDNSLQNKLSTRLDTLVSDFKNETVEYSVVSMELDTIDKMNISGLAEKLNNSKETIDNLNASRTAFNTAETFFNSGDYADAIPQYKQVIADDPNYDKAIDGVSKATNAYRQQVLTTAADYADKNDYDSAINTLNSALAVITNDSDVTQQLNIYKTKQIDATRQSALDTAAGYASNNDWTDAISTLNTALLNLPDDPTLTQQLNTYKTAQTDSQRQTALDTATGYADSKDWANAINTLNAALVDLPGDYKLTSQLNTYQASCVTDTLSQADTLVKQKNYDDATTLVNNALTVVPDNADLQSELDNINTAITIAQMNNNADSTTAPDSNVSSDKEIMITDLTPYSGNGFLQGTSFKVRQEEINAVNCYNTPSTYYDENTTTYILDKKYKTIKGTLAFVDGGSNNSTLYRELKITGDGQVLTCFYMNTADKPYSFEIDVSNVSSITIQCGGSLRFYNVTIVEGTTIYNNGYFPMQKLTPYSGNGFNAGKFTLNIRQQATEMFNRYYTPSTYYDENTTTYILDKKYKTIKGILAFADGGSTNSTLYRELKITGDGRVLYDDYVEENSYPLDIEVNVSGVDQLTIQCGGSVYFYNVNIYE